MTGIFGQKVKTGVKWYIERTPDDLDISGLITKEMVEGSSSCEEPADLTDCEIDIIFYNEDGTEKYRLSSTGISPAITIIEGVNHDPNFTIFLSNADLIVAFPQDITVPYRFLFTNSAGVPQTYWTGSAIIGNSTLNQEC